MLGAGFTVGSGSCVANGTCVQTPNYPSSYGTNEACSITADAAGTLAVEGFSTESGFDKLTLGGVEYQGTSGPSGVAVSAGEAMSWSSDHSGESTGWRICYSSRRSRQLLQQGDTSWPSCVQCERAILVFVCECCST